MIYGKFPIAHAADDDFDAQGCDGAQAPFAGRAAGKDDGFP